MAMERSKEDEEEEDERVDENQPTLLKLRKLVRKVVGQHKCDKN